MNSLYLNITDYCNMRCVYCYGNHGNYYRTDSLKNMNYAIASKSIDVALKLYNDLRVVFFGGEPLINYPLIEQIVKTYKGRVRFCIITNGVLLDERRIRFLGENDFAITVSFEGSFRAQKYRKGINDEDTYEKVISNLRKLDLMDYKYSIRMTLFRNNAVLSERLKSLENLKNIREIRVQFCSPTGSVCDLEDKDIIEYEKDLNKAMKMDLYNKCVQSSYGQVSTTVCTMGITGFAVDTDGYVYPCYRFIGKNEFCMGHINDFSKDKLWEIAVLNKVEGKEMQYCFADEYI